MSESIETELNDYERAREKMREDLRRYRDSERTAVHRQHRPNRVFVRLNENELKVWEDIAKFVGAHDVRDLLEIILRADLKMISGLDPSRLREEIHVPFVMDPAVAAQLQRAKEEAYGPF